MEIINFDSKKVLFEFNQKSLGELLNTLYQHAHTEENLAGFIPDSLSWMIKKLEAANENMNLLGVIDRNKP